MNSYFLGLTMNGVNITVTECLYHMFEASFIFAA